MEGNPAPPYAQSGLIYPVSDVLSASTAGNLIPKFLKDGQYQGTSYGIPFTTSTRAMYYNKKIFAAAGISAPPKTWAELQSDAAKIKARGSVGYGMPLGSEEAQAELLLWFLGNGGGYLSAQGTYEINSPQNVATLNYISSIPAELEQAAMVDGSSRLGALFRITLPLAMPGVVTALIFTFIAAWNEFISALTLTTSNADYPLTVRLDSFIGQYKVDWQHLFGASVVATIPVFILFALIEGRVVGGLTAGSVK